MALVRAPATSENATTTTRNAERTKRSSFTRAHERPAWREESSTTRFGGVHGAEQGRAGNRGRGGRKWGHLMHGQRSMICAHPSAQQPGRERTPGREEPGETGACPRFAWMHHRAAPDSRSILGGDGAVERRCQLGGPKLVNGADKPAGRPTSQTLGGGDGRHGEREAWNPRGGDREGPH